MPNHCAVREPGHRTRGRADLPLWPRIRQTHRQHGCVRLSSTCFYTAREHVQRQPNSFARAGRIETLALCGAASTLPHGQMSIDCPACSPRHMRVGWATQLLCSQAVQSPVLRSDQDVRPATDHSSWNFPSRSPTATGHGFALARHNRKVPSNSAWHACSAKLNTDSPVASRWTTSPPRSVENSTISQCPSPAANVRAVLSAGPRGPSRPRDQPGDPLRRRAPVIERCYRGDHNIAKRIRHLGAKDGKN